MHTVTSLTVDIMAVMMKKMVLGVCQFARKLFFVWASCKIDGDEEKRSEFSMVGTTEQQACPADYAIVSSVIVSFSLPHDRLPYN